MTDIQEAIFPLHFVNLRLSILNLDPDNSIIFASKQGDRRREFATARTKYEKKRLLFNRDEDFYFI